MMLLTERTKIMDAIWVDHKILLRQLTTQVQKFEIEKDEDIVEIVESQKIKLQNKIKEVQQSS